MIEELQQGLREAVLEMRSEEWRHHGRHAVAEAEITASGEGWSLLDTARLYSTACNALLQSVACAYLKLVHSEDCDDEQSPTNTVY